jgi:predicted RNA-binding Zn-ribbon protein involved in translation (DUF1610 family)
VKTDTPKLMSFVAESPKPDPMQTLICGSCRMALYMADRKLKAPTWKCPSCGAITRT